MDNVVIRKYVGGQFVYKEGVWQELGRPGGESRKQKGYTKMGMRIWVTYMRCNLLTLCAAQEGGGWGKDVHTHPYQDNFL